jgi:hypothetical protein
MPNKQEGGTCIDEALTKIKELEAYTCFANLCGCRFLMDDGMICMNGNEDCYLATTGKLEGNNHLAGEKLCCSVAALVDGRGLHCKGDMSRPRYRHRCMLPLYASRVLQHTNLLLSKFLNRAMRRNALCALHVRRRILRETVDSRAILFLETQEGAPLRRQLQCICPLSLQFDCVASLSATMELTTRTRQTGILDKFPSYIYFKRANSVRYTQSKAEGTRSQGTTGPSCATTYAYGNCESGRYISGKHGKARHSAAILQSSRSLFLQSNSSVASLGATMLWRGLAGQISLSLLERLGTPRERSVRSAHPTRNS